MLLKHDLIQVILSQEVPSMLAFKLWTFKDENVCSHVQFMYVGYIVMCVHSPQVTVVLCTLQYCIEDSFFISSPGVQKQT